MEEEMNNWWTGLTVAEKEQIAFKAKIKGGEVINDTCYPACTKWWSKAMLSTKLRIYEHCKDGHGMITHKWQEGQSFSY